MRTSRIELEQFYDSLAPAAKDGQRRVVQYFERAVFSYDAETGVRLEPLGWAALVRARVRGCPFGMRLG